MTDRVRYEALVRRYERMSVARPGYPVGADGPFPAHIRVGSVRLPVQMEGGRIVALGTHPLARHVLADLLAGLERACRVSSRMGGLVS